MPDEETGIAQRPSPCKQDDPMSQQDCLRDTDWEGPYDDYGARDTPMSFWSQTSRLLAERGVECILDSCKMRDKE